MTITFSVELLFRGALLAITVPLFVIAYVQGWRYFFCEKYKGDREFGIFFWVGAAVALIFSFIVIIANSAWLCE